MTHDEQIAVIAAHRDGKAIQYWYPNTETWGDLSKTARFNFVEWDYRVKPEPKPDYHLIRNLWNDSRSAEPVARVEVTFDGETNKPKSVRLV